MYTSSKRNELLQENSAPTDENNGNRYLSGSEVDLLSASFQMLAEYKARNGLAIFLRLFQEHPEFKQLFPRLRSIGDQFLGGSHQLRSFALLIMDTIHNLLATMNDEANLLQVVQTITEVHKTHAVQKKHIMAMVPMVVITLKSCGSLDEETEGAWNKFFTIFADPLD